MATQAEFQAALEELAPQIAHEPRPRAAIRVGAIGHRRLDPVLAPKIAETVAVALSLVARAAGEALGEPDIAEQFAPGLDLIVISPLAEGADRLIAEQGLAQGYRVGAVLPFVQHAYEATFDLGDRDTAIAHFRGLLARAQRPKGYGVLVLDGDPAEGAPRDAAFQYCATAVTAWSDVLIAILAEERAPSQTGESFGDALAAGVPVIVIDPATPEQFHVHGENVAEGSGPDTALARAVRTILAPTTHREGEGKKARRGYTILSYAHERFRLNAGAPCDFEYQGPYRAKTEAPWVLRPFIGLYGAIERLFRRRSPKQEDNSAVAFLWDLPLDSEEIRPLAELHLRYQRADTTADAYAGLQRSVQLIIALFGVLTVLFSALGPATGPYETVFAGLELFTLSAALLLVYVSYSQNWLHRWLDCRLVAELLRYARFLLLVGQFSPPGLDDRGSAAPDERAWVRDHARNVLRAHGFTVPGRGSRIDESAIGKIARYVAKRAIDDQVRYHDEVGRSRVRLGDALKTASFTVSAFAFLVVAGKFGLELLESFGMAFRSDKVLDNWLELAAVILPALAAAILGWRAFGEFEIIGRRSEQMADALARGRVQLLAAPNLRALGERTRATVLLLLQHVDGFRELYAGKHLES